MEFVNNLNNLVLDDQYFMDVPTVQGTGNVPTGNIGLVGTFSRGPLNTPTLVTSYPDLVKKFGEVDANFTLTGTIAARGIFKQGNSNVYVVRVSAASPSQASTATAAIKDTSATPITVFTLNAATPGTWGNSLTATVSAGTKSGTYKVSLQYGAESETWDNLIIAQPATPIQGAVLASTVFGTSATAMGQSQLAYGTFPATPVTSAWATTNGTSPVTYTFAGGTDGATTVDTDYTGSTATAGVKQGINALDNAPVNLILCAEQSSATINSALIANAENTAINGGFPRIAVITFPQGTSVTAAAALTADMDTDRAIAVYPWLNIYDPITNANHTVSPLGYFAGVLAQLSPHLSPGNKRINGINGYDPNLNLGASDITALSQARIIATGVQTPAGYIGIRQGMTLSQSGIDVYVRRMKDYIDQLVFTIGGQFVDAPITAALMQQVKQSVDNILAPMKTPATGPSDQMIADYQITCDTSNNPTSVTDQNQLICDYLVKLLNMDKFMVFRTQISSGVVISSNK